MSMEITGIVSNLANFGAAGLMGAMWLWERKLSRMREYQLTQAHERIIRDEQRLDKLTRVVEQNTSAMTGSIETQRQVVEAIKDLAREFHHAKT